MKIYMKYNMYINIYTKIKKPKQVCHCTNFKLVQQFLLKILTKSSADSRCAETNVGNVNSPLQHLVSYKRLIFEQYVM